MYFDIENTWETLVEVSGNSSVLKDAGKMFLRNRGNQVEPADIENYVKNRLEVESSFETSYQNFIKLCEMTIFSNHDYNYKYLIFLLEKMEETHEFGVDKDMMKTLTQQITREILKEESPLPAEFSRQGSPLRTLIDSLKRNQTPIQALTCEKFWSLKSINIISRIFASYISKLPDIGGKALEKMNQQLFNIDDFLSPLMFHHMANKSGSPVKFFSAGSYEVSILGWLEEQQIPKFESPQAKGYPYWLVQKQLLMAGANVSKILHFVYDLTKDYETDAKTKSLILSEQIDKLCTKRIFSLDNSQSQHTIVDKSTVESIELPLSRATKATVLTDDRSLVGPRKLEMTPVKAQYVVNETPQKYAIQDGTTKVIYMRDRSQSYSDSITDSDFGTKKGPDQMNVLIPVLGFATIAVGIYAFNS